MPLSLARRVAVFAATFLAASVSLAFALTPTVVWNVPGAAFGVFSANGSAVLVTTATGFELRRATDGVVLRTLTLPEGSRGYETMAFSPDQSLVGLAFHFGGLDRIELWRVSDGLLQRTIPTGAVRSIKSISFSPTGLIASMERFAYGGGGMMRVFRVSDGSLAVQQGPYTRSSLCDVSFSPTGAYLEVQDNVGANGIRVLRSSDWGTAFTVPSTSMLDWSVDGGSFWTYGSSSNDMPYERVGVPGGGVSQSVMIDDGLSLYISAATPDGHSFLASQVVSTDPGSPSGNVLEFLSVATGAPQTVYQFPSPIVSAGRVSPDGKLFSYAICPTDGGACTFYVARMPGATLAAPGPGMATRATLELRGPSPTARGTDVVFTLPRDGDASVSVYGVNGGVVRRLAGGAFSAGEHRVAWDGRTNGGGRAPAGVYFVRLNTSETTTSGSVVVLE